MSGVRVTIRGATGSRDAPFRVDAPTSSKGVEADDPYELVGVPIPVEPGVDGDRELARAFAEEFALAGWPPGRILELFAQPASGRAHEIWRRRGAALIEELVGDVFGPAAGPSGGED